MTTLSERIRRIPSILVAGLVLCTLARSGHAYCVRKDDVMLAWRDSFSDRTIPVYVVSSGKSSVASTGHSPTDVARIVHEVIARHNETVAIPKLRFGGFTDKQWVPDSQVPHAELEGGITILSYLCENLDAQTQGNLCSPLSNPGVHACTNIFRPPAGMLALLALLTIRRARADTRPRSRS